MLSDTFIRSDLICRKLVYRVNENGMLAQERIYTETTTSKYLFKIV